MEPWGQRVVTPRNPVPISPSLLLSRSRPISNTNPSKKLNFLHFQVSWRRGWRRKEA